MINKSPVITNEGLSLLSRAVSDAYKVVFTRCELGDGVYSGDPKEATSLVSPKETTSNTSSSATIGQIKLSSLLNCSTITADFVCREYGVYAVLKKVTLGQNITEGSEVLFAYACDEVGGMIRKTSPSVNMYYNIDLTMQISDSVITEIVTNDVELFASKTVFEGHTANIDNPHRVTKEQIGLGNVPNVSTNEQTPTYQVSPDLQLLASGERLAYTLSKTAKAVQELKQHLEAENPHNLTADDIGAVSVEEVNARLPKSGGEMTGHLTMSLNRYLVFESGASDGSCFVFHSVDGQFFVHKMANGQVMETPLRITAEGEVFINNVEVNGQGGGLMVVIDEFLSEESQNPVANSAITSALLALQTMITDKVNADDVLEVIAPVLANYANSSHSHTLDEVSETTSKKIMTATERTKLSGIAEGANKTVVDTALSATSTNPVQNKVINTALNGKAEAIHPHNMADIADLPQIVTHGATGEWSNTGSADTFLATTSYVDGRAEDYVLYVASNRFCTHDNPDQLVAKFNETATGLSNILVLKAEQTDLYTQYKQFICTSKTSPNFQFGHLYEISYDEEADEFTISDVNPEFSLVETASGGEGASITVDDALSNTSTNPVQNKIVKAALDSKSDSSHTHSNYAASDHTHSGYATTTALSNMLPKSGGTMTGALDMAANVNLANNKYLNFYMSGQNFRYTFHADESGKFYLHKLNSNGTTDRTPIRVQPNGDLELNHTGDNKVSVKADGKLYINGAEVISTGSATVAKTWVALGDSKTDFNHGRADNYPKWIIDRNPKITLTNLGSAGGLITNERVTNAGDTTPLYKSMYTKATEITGTPDIITVAGGYNDWNWAIPLGRFTTDISNYDTSASANVPTANIVRPLKNTFYMGVFRLAKYLTERFPLTPILWITPFPTTAQNNGQSNGANVCLPLGDYVNAIKEVCAYFSIPVCDMFTAAGLTPFTASNLSNYWRNGDGVHPNGEGSKIYSYKIEKAMRETYENWGKVW